MNGSRIYCILVLSLLFFGVGCANCQSSSASTNGVTIAMLPFRNQTGSDNIERLIEPIVYKALTHRSSKKLTFVDRTHLEQVLREQALGLTGSIDEATAAKTGELLGASHIIIVDITEANGENSMNQTATYQAYSVQSSKSTRSEDYHGTTRTYQTTHYTGTPVSIAVYQGSGTFIIRSSITVISTQTGAILWSGDEYSGIEDKVEFADCGGCNYSSLSQSIPNDEEVETTSMATYYGGGGLSNSMFRGLGQGNSPVSAQLFGSKRNSASESQLKGAAIRDMGTKISNTILSLF